MQTDLESIDLSLKGNKKRHRFTSRHLSHVFRTAMCDDAPSNGSDHTVRLGVPNMFEYHFGVFHFTDGFVKGLEIERLR